MTAFDLRPERLKYLLQQYASASCSKAELLELLECVDSGRQDEDLRQIMEAQWKEITDEGELPSLDRERIFLNIIGQAPAHAEIQNHRRLPWGRIAAAAAVILILGGGWLWYTGKNRSGHPYDTQEALLNKVIPSKNDADPGGNKAILTLADGTAIGLDSAHNGALSRQGNTVVMKLSNGQLAYKGGEAANTLTYNKVTTPRGGKYEVTLPDGSKVWMNAASTLRFPTAFSGTERRVELSGEAFFEIAKDKNKPFYVQANGTNVEVLGTQFNIMAYDEENAVRTTLLEGSVKVTGAAGDGIRLSPGEQVQDSKEDGLKLVNNANVDEAMAWKDDLFYFHGADIRTIMRQLARWYDIEVVYNGNINGRFYARIPRNTKMSTVLRALALTNKLNFTVEGKKVIIQP